MKRPPRTVLACAALAVTAMGLLARQAARAAAPPPASQGLALFTSDVRPLLTQRCLKCHGGEKTKGEFDLVTREGLLHPGKDGPNVVPGDSRKSRLMTLIRHEDDPTMPAKAEKLPDAAIAKIAAWIDAGAPYDKPLIERAGAKRNRGVVSEEDRQFWSFRPLTDPAAPAVKDQSSWVRTPVDRFVLA